jgi:amidase
MAGIKSFMKAIASQQPWYKDPLAVRKPWNETEYNLIDHGNGDNLCFAILWDDEDMVPHPPVIRGLEETKQALLAAGHQVINWKPLKHAEICEIAVRIFFVKSSVLTVTSNRWPFGMRVQLKITASRRLRQGNLSLLT